MTQETLNDFAETWLQARKLLRTYEAATQAGLWKNAADAAEELREAAYNLNLYAQCRAAVQK